MSRKTDDPLEELRKIRGRLWRRLSRLAPAEQLRELERLSEAVQKRAGVRLETIPVRAGQPKRIRKSG